MKELTGTHVIVMEYGCVVTVEEGKLLYAPLCMPPEDYCEVSAPPDQDFLDVVNFYFSTNFQMSDFAGR